MSSPDEFKTSPLATKVIGSLAGIIVAIFGWWCVRVTQQLDKLVESSASNEQLAKTVVEHTQHISQLYVNYNALDKKAVVVDGLVKDVDIIKDKLFR